METKKIIYLTSISILFSYFDKKKEVDISIIARETEDHMKKIGWIMNISSKQISVLFRKHGISIERRGHKNLSYPIINEEIITKLRNTPIDNI